MIILKHLNTLLWITRSLGALWAQTSGWRPFGFLDFVLRALQGLRPCDPRKVEQHLIVHLIQLMFTGGPQNAQIFFMAAW